MLSPSRHGGPQWRVSSPASGPLDLDHVGAEVAERHRGERAREHAREVGDEEPVERAGGGGHRPRSLVCGPMRTLVVSDLHLGSPQRRRPAAPARPARAAARGDRGRRPARDPRRRARAARERRSATRPSWPATCSPTSAARSGPTASSCCSAATTTTGSSRAGSTAACSPSRRASSASSSGSRPSDAGPLAAPPRRARRARARARSPTPGCGCATTSTRIHGHYSDLHTTVPTFERLAAGAMARWVVRLPPDHATRRRLRGRARAALRVDARAHPALRAHGALTGGAGASARAWVALAGEGRRRHPLRAAALGAGYTAAVAGLNALGLGPIAARPAPARRCAAAACTGMREVLRRLGRRRAARALGPLAPLRPVAGRRPAEWTTPAGARIAQHRLLGLPAALPHRRAERARPTGRAPRSCVEDERPAASSSACSATAGTRSSAPRPGVKQVAWQVDARRRPRARARRACGAPCSTSGYAAGPVDRDRAAVDAHRPRRPRAPPTRRPPRTGRSRRRAGRRSGPAAARPARPRAAAAASELALDAEQRLDLALGLARRRPRRSASSSSAPSRVPQVARRPALVAVEVPQLEPLVDHDRVLRSRAAPPRARTVVVVARGQEAAGVDADHAQAVVARSARATPSGTAACAAS